MPPSGVHSMRKRGYRLCRPANQLCNHAACEDNATAAEHVEAAFPPKSSLHHENKFWERNDSWLLDLQLVAICQVTCGSHISVKLQSGYPEIVELLMLESEIT
eukprot:g35952.t1